MFCKCRSDSSLDARASEVALSQSTYTDANGKQQSIGEWMSDDAVSHCLGCRAPFSLAISKHHCRCCGLIYCHACSNNVVKIPGRNVLRRVCKYCIDMVRAENDLHDNILAYLKAGVVFKDKNVFKIRHKMVVIRLLSSHTIMVLERPEAGKIKEIFVMQIGDIIPTDFESIRFTLMSSKKIYNLTCSSPEAQQKWIHAMKELKRHISDVPFVERVRALRMNIVEKHMPQTSPQQSPRLNIK